MSTCSVSHTGVLLQVAEGKSEGEPADGSSVDGETASSTWTSSAGDNNTSHTRGEASADGVPLLANEMCACEVKHELKTGKRRPVVERPLEGASTDSMLHHLRASHGWSFVTLETRWTCLFSLSLVAVRRFRSPHIEGAFERSCK